ncbi:MAG TPA: hypothetical protein VGM93_09430, partial [Acidimicrobiales bacterium]
MDAADGVNHLQAAAREMVAAGRSFLDAVEDVVEDNDRMASVVSGMTDLLGQITDSVSKFGANLPRPDRE